MKTIRSSAALLALFGGEVTFVDTACRVHSPSLSFFVVVFAARLRALQNLGCRF